MVRGGGSAQAVRSLVDFGRRLIVVDFVSFLLLFRDSQVNFMVPFALASENLALEAVELQRTLDSSLDKLRATLSYCPSFVLPPMGCRVYNTTNGSEPLLPGRWCTLDGTYQKAPSRMTEDQKMIFGRRAGVVF